MNPSSHKTNLFYFLSKSIFLVSKKIRKTGNKYKQEVAKNTPKFSSTICDKYIDKGFE